MNPALEFGSPSVYSKTTRIYHYEIRCKYMLKRGPDCNATAGVIVRRALVSFKREVVSGLQFSDE